MLILWVLESKIRQHKGNGVSLIKSQSVDNERIWSSKQLYSSCYQRVHLATEKCSTNHSLEQTDNWLRFTS